jgi:long-chain acyl-CoA synthetase
MSLIDLDLYRTEVSVSIAPRVRLSVIDAGPRGAEHTILFLHGFGGYALQWEKQLARFVESCRVVAPDLRGHGLSDHPDSLYTMPELVGDLERVVEQLQLPKQFIVVGHSFGGAIAASYTIQNPARVEKLILIGTASNFKMGIEQEVLARLPIQAFELLRQRLPVQYNAPFFVMRRMYTDTVAPFDGKQVFPQVRVPTLIILGVRDLVFEQARYEEVADLIPNAQLAKISVSAHMVQLERSDAVNRAIQRFMRQDTSPESVSWREGRQVEKIKLLQKRPWLAHYEDDVPYTLYYPTQPLFTFLDIAARRFPSATATVFYGSTLSYRSLRRQANRFANGLTQLGIEPGDRVALHLPNCPQFVIGYYGALKAGAVVVNLNPQSDAEELKHHLEDSGARALLTLHSAYPALSKLQAPTLEHIILTDLGEYVSHVRRYFLRGRNYLPPTPLLDKAPPPGVHYLQKFLDAANKETPLVHVSPHDLALIQYSTGTTDLPKGVMLTHANLVANTMQLRHWLPDVTEGQERILAALPLAHSYAMTTAMNFAVAIAGAILLLPTTHTGQMLEAIQLYHPSIFPGVPSLFLAINQFPNARKFGVRYIRACLSGAAPLPLEVQEAFEKITRGRLVEGYGLTEASPVTHANPIFGDAVPGTIGLPLPDTDAKIVDMETGWDLPVGEIGELVVRGPQVMKGYWNNSAQTERALRDGWLYTGDIARMDAEGYFTFIDRKSDLIYKNGQMIFPRDIEEVLFEHPKVSEAAVVGIRHREREDRAKAEARSEKRETKRQLPITDHEIIKAYIVPKRGEKPTPDEILKFARSRLPEASVPDEIEFRTELPKTFVGKVFKRKLLEAENTADTESGDASSRIARRASIARDDASE